MAYPIFFAFFQNILYYMYIREKKKRLLLHQKHSLKIIKNYIIIYIVNEKKELQVMYPIEKYKFYTNGSRVIAVSTYAGKTVRGVAVCHAGDAFSLEKGKKLAALRCAEKIAKKRVARANQKVDEAYWAYVDAETYLDKMVDYKDDALYELNEVIAAKNDMLDSL